MAIIIASIAIYAFKYPKVDFKEDTTDGIQFFKGTFKEALEKAQAEDKPIFLDIYATWCGPCKMLKKKTFSTKEVGDYYNANFINIAVDGETAEGRELVQKYNIQGYPTLLILDKRGKQLTNQVGFVEPHILVNFGKRIIP
jgi:thiol:disulfide interchange protein